MFIPGSNTKGLNRAVSPRRIETSASHFTKAPISMFRVMTKPAPQSAFVNAAALAVFFTAGAVVGGCFETVSLGSGEGDGSGGSRGETTFTLHFPREESAGVGFTLGGFDCFAGLTTDLDGDGYSAVSGDCNDCDPDVGPASVEMPTAPGESPKDENCNGKVDEAPPSCDSNLVVNDPTAIAGARAIDICNEASQSNFGVVNAVWVLPDGTKPPQADAFALGHGILERFGPNVPTRLGNRMLALSSGTARQPADIDYKDTRGFDKGYVSKPPDGTIPTVPECPQMVSGAPHDGIALELTLRAPQNADALAFDFNFYSYEFPEHVCTPNDDMFAALLFDAHHQLEPKQIAHDLFGKAIRVGSVTFEACACEGGPPCTAGGRDYGCSLGAGPLVQTGFGWDEDNGDRGATGWLTAGEEIQRGKTFVLRLSVHDAADGEADSTVLIDRFRWEPVEPLVARTRRPELE